MCQKCGEPKPLTDYRRRWTDSDVRMNVCNSCHYASERARRDLTKPVWDGETGELWYRGQMVGRIKRAGTEIMKILATFQDDDWPRRIDDPLDPSPETRKLSQAVYSLNKGLSQIKFRVSGEGIIWDRNDEC